MRIPVVDLNKTGQNICVLRKRSGVSVRELQELLGFATPQAIYKWQHGISLPTVDNLVALASILDVSVEEILAVDYPKGEE
jgi:transcriptional regulator with XRE-family HTH domain